MSLKSILRTLCESFTKCHNRGLLLTKVQQNLRGHHVLSGINSDRLLLGFDCHHYKSKVIVTKCDVADPHPWELNSFITEQMKNKTDYVFQ